MNQQGIVYTVISWRILNNSPQPMPCDYKNYPLDWFTRIRPAILERAGNRCEFCGAPNYGILSVPDREVIEPCNTYAEALQKLKHCHSSDQCDGFIIIVLTIAHLDHFPMNCSPENLKALCQKCHNAYDAKHRAKTRREKHAATLESIAPSLQLVTSITTTA